MPRLGKGTKCVKTFPRRPQKARKNPSFRCFSPSSARTSSLRKRSLPAFSGRDFSAKRHAARPKGHFVPSEWEKNPSKRGENSIRNRRKNYPGQERNLSRYAQKSAASPARGAAPFFSGKSRVTASQARPFNESLSFRRRCRGPWASGRRRAPRPCGPAGRTRPTNVRTAQRP